MHATHDQFEPPVNYPPMDESDFSELEREQAFIKKWLTPGVKNDIGEYWTRTPCRVYWALVFDTVLGSEQVAMAQDLNAIYDNSTTGNSALLHARELIANSNA